MGSAPGEPGRLGEVVFGGEGDAYQHEGVEGEFSRYTTFCNAGTQDNSGTCGQYHSPSVHQTSRGNTLFLPLRGSEKPAMLGGPEPDVISHSVHTGQMQCPGRRAKLSPADSSLRVDTRV